MNRKNDWRDINDLYYFVKDKTADKEPEVVKIYEPEPPRPQGSLFDPRWYQVNQLRAKDSPQEADFGDEIMLEIKVEGIVEGAGIDIVVIDNASRAPFLTKRTIRTRVTKGLLQAKWKIERNKNDAGEPEYLFDAHYDGYSGKASCTSKRIPLFKKIECDYIEIPEILFNFDSPLPCIDADGKLLATLLSTFKFTKDNPDKEIVLFGHTDSTGDQSYNYDLSKWRSEAVKALLDGDKTRWVDFAEPQATIEDVQRFLSVLTKSYGWRCDPGAIDNKDGPKTKTAREAFQRQYNEKFTGTLKKDGIFGEKSWGAVFEVIRSLLQDAYKKATNEDTFPQLTFGYNGKGVYPCGESFPVEGLAGSDQKNRRVEIVFFDKGKAPALLDHPDKTNSVSVKENPVYDSKKTKKKPIDIIFEPLEVIVDKVSIAFFFDGTGCNENMDRPLGKESNIAKLHELFDEQKDRQTGFFTHRKYYLNGVGTDHNEWYKNIPGLGFGQGGKGKIVQALDELKSFVESHSSVETIPVDVFGFSRGAALARAFVNSIYGDFPGDGAKMAKWKKPDNVKVRFLGLFDTVGSFGMPGDDVNKGYILDVHASRVERVVHFTAKHEYRQMYDLTSIKRLLSNHERYKANPYNQFMEIKPLPSHMMERSFIGSHGDVGGGAAPGQEGKRNELSRIPLYAMVDEARKAGVLMLTPEEYRDRDSYGRTRYFESFTIPDDLKPLLNTRHNQNQYDTLTKSSDIFNHEIFGNYVHDSRDDYASGALMDNLSTKRNVFLRGVY